jgi:hypothetical protein
MMFAATFRSVTGEDVVALQITEDNLEEIAAWTDGAVIRFSKELLSGKVDFVGVRFQTMNGTVHARVGEWVVQREKDVFQFRNYSDLIFKNLFSHI